MNSRINKTKNIAVIGCGYWGTIIANNLLNLGYKNFYIYDINIKNSQNLKKNSKKLLFLEIIMIILQILL